MAKQEFLNNFRIARNLFFHPRVATDDSNLDPQVREQKIARAAIWLTPKSVTGFKADDFPELGIDRQRELQAAVQEFLRAANQVPPKAPASPDQLVQGKTAFEKMLQLLLPYLPAPEEGEKVEEALQSVEFPPWLVNWDYELGNDEDGAPAVWVILYADESCAPRREFGRVASRLNAKIYEALTAVGSNSWPYVRMRTAFEHKTL